MGIDLAIFNIEERESQGLSFLLEKNQYYHTSIITPKPTYLLIWIPTIMVC